MTRSRIRCHSRAVILALTLGLGTIGAPAPSIGQEGAQGLRPGLESLFATGAIFQDRNGDGFVDFVDAGLVLGINRSASELAAAMDVAARLGFESMAMNIPVPRQTSGSGVGILIGRAGVERAGVAVPELTALAAGEGIVTRLSSAGREWVVIAGADDAGTRAAAAAFAGRLPHVGEPQGATLADLIEDLGGYLGEVGVAFEAIWVPTVRVTDAAEGAFTAVDAVVLLATTGDLERARAALEAVPTVRAEPAPPEPETAPAVNDNEPGEPASEDRAKLLSYPGAVVLKVHLQEPAGAVAQVEIPRVVPEPPTRPIAQRPGSGGKDELDLSNLFHPDGLLGDSDSNEIPDRIDAVLSAVGEGTDGAIDLAARLGLESAGITLPVGRAPGDIDQASSEPTLVVIGTEHPLIEQMLDDGKLSEERIASLTAGEGLIEVVPDAFGKKRALLVTGGDAAGVARALEQLAQTFPNLSERGKDRNTVEDVELAVWRFLAQRSPGGQAAAALYKLDRMVEELEGKQIESARVTVSLEKIEPGLEALVRSRMASLGIVDLQVKIDDRDVQNAAVIIDERIEIASEVDEFWSLFRDRVLPAVERDRAIRLEARLSEPPEVRGRIAAEARAMLVEAGANPATTEVSVLSAFKQGFSWLREAILPELRQLQADAGMPRIGRIRVSFAEAGPPEEWPQGAMYSKVRWLKEIWPIDEVLTNELDLALELVDFVMAPIDAPTYEVMVTATDGSELLRRTFEPKYVLRPHFDRFRDFEMVRVTTGWMSAALEGQTLVDERIVTDIERFWDHYQSQTLPAIYDYVMDRHEGNPRDSDGPYFGELTVEVSLSEPDYMLGIDNEYISSLDSLHEEIYFPTLFFFRMLGRMARGDELTYIGRVLPIMHPKGDGASGWANIRLTGFATSRPAVVIDYTEAGGRKSQLRRDVPLVSVERPSALAATVRAGQEGVERLDLRVKVDFESDDRSELLNRADEYQIDTRIMTAAQATAMVGNLGVLRAQGLYLDELAFQGLGTIRLAAGWDWKIEPDTQSVVILDANGIPRPYPTAEDLLPEGDYTYGGEELVQWDTPIPPPEGHAILARMATFPEATIYRVGQSYLGKDIWAMDLMPPIEASHWSHYKATTFKPTVIYSAREHANEVSSTSHVLKLAELLLTDEEFKKKLLNVNVIVHPFTNPDGAQLAYDLYRITPDFILHAGYLGALGMGATSGGNADNPSYPESKVRPKLWATWLPDIFMNPHGYPSHEVVQLFSEYAGLVRRGRVTERNWSVNRGWFIPGFRYLDDPRYPRHKEAAFKIRGYITRYINEASEVRALNDRAYDRYRRYGADFEPIIYRQDMTDGVNIQMPLTGARAGEGDRSRRGFNPKVTIWNGGTEAPDETAHGDWMKLVATAGLQWDKAILDYLFEGEHKVEHHGKSFWGGAVRLWHDRPRPPKPDESDDEAGEGSPGGR